MQKFLIPTVFMVFLLIGVASGVVSLTTSMEPAEFTQSLETDPYLYYSLGTFLAQEGLDEPAQAALLTSLEKGETPEAWYNLGYLLYQENDLEQAELAFHHAIRLNTEYVKPWYGLGIIALEQEQWEEAADALDEVVRLNPEDHHAWFDRGLAYTGRFRYLGQDTLEKAVSSFTKAYQLEPGMQEAEKNLEVLERFS